MRSHCKFIFRVTGYRRYTSISNLNLINYYDSRQSTYRFDGENKGKDGRGGGERSRTYSKPIKYKQPQGSEMSYVDESFEYKRTIKLPPVERGGSFEYNSTRNSIKKKFLNKSNFFSPQNNRK